MADVILMWPLPNFDPISFAKSNRKKIWRRESKVINYESRIDLSKSNDIYGELDNWK